eukprot:9493416-Pyramimonas_sp.AAC.1
MKNGNDASIERREACVTERRSSRSRTAGTTNIFGLKPGASDILAVFTMPPENHAKGRLSNKSSTRRLRAPNMVASPDLAAPSSPHERTHRA